MTGIRLAVVAFLTVSPPILAEDAVDDVDTIVVTGSRSTDQLAEIPHTTTVIRLEDLEARNAVSVPDALRHLPGIHVVQPSGQGGRCEPHASVATLRADGRRYVGRAF